MSWILLKRFPNVYSPLPSKEEHHLRLIKPVFQFNAIFFTNLNVLYQYSYVKFENSKRSQKWDLESFPIAVKIITKTLSLSSVLNCTNTTKTMVDKLLVTYSRLKSVAPNYISGKYSSLPCNLGDKWLQFHIIYLVEAVNTIIRFSHLKIYLCNILMKWDKHLCCTCKNICMRRDTCAIIWATR